MEIDIEKLTCGIQLTDIERNVLEYLLTHLDQALKLGVRGVARENFTSTSTVMRLSRITFSDSRWSCCRRRCHRHGSAAHTKR